MNDLRLISADSHVNEPGDLWVERIDTQFRDRAPRVIENPPGLKPGAYLTLEGIPPIHLAQGMGAGKKPDELPQFFQASTYNDRRAGGWDPAERTKDMDLDGVEVDVIYTTLGFRQFWLTDAGLQRACFRVYNDWLADYCAYAPKRLAGLALISLYDVAEGVKELGRCAKRGLKGALIWASPPESRPYSSPDYDPFWAAAQELEMPISLHSITGMGAESRLAIKTPLDRYVRSAVLCHEVQRTLVVLIFAGVLERFPTLKVVSAENEVGWVPFFLQKLDQAQEEYRYLYPAPLKRRPTEYFRRQVFATFIDDPVGVVTREFIGVENILWSSDYPHTVSTWPNSREVIARDFKNVPEKETRMIVRENAARLYRLDLP